MPNGIAQAPRPRRAMTDNSERVNRFRDSAKELGMVQVNVYVPEERKAWIQAQAEYYRAEAMIMSVINLPVLHPGRIALANRNYASVPKKENLDYIDQMIRVYKFNDLKPELEAIRENMTLYNANRMAVGLINNDDEQVYRLSSLAVAYSMMAAATYRWLRLRLDDRIERLPVEGTR